MRSLPWSWYADPALERVERDRIFRRVWHYIGRTEQVAATGSYVAADAGGVPVLVTRDRAERLHAFVNVCRHRGSILVDDGEGRRETLQCRYHCWTYDLDGSLRAAPRADRELAAQRCDSIAGLSTRSPPTGRSRARTTSSATTAPAPIRRSARSSTCGPSRTRSTRTARRRASSARSAPM